MSGGSSLAHEDEGAGRLLPWELVWSTSPVDGVWSHKSIRQVKPKVKGIYGHLARDHLRQRKY